MKTLENPSILIVDDELSVGKSCVKVFERISWSAKSVLSGKEAIALLEIEDFDVILTDLKMAEMGGMELLEMIKVRFPLVVPVVISGYSSVASAVETLKLGAFDYLPKPFTPAELISVTEKALKRRQLLIEKDAIKEGENISSIDGIIGSSPKMLKLFSMIKKVAPTGSTVLILGESGTGKELVARAIHNRSKRKDEKFIPVDCGTLNRDILESELFGHTKGSFTGAFAKKEGIFESADNGTVFLDEICNISLEIQGKLLRFIEEREFIPVGGTEPRKVDVRLIFASNRDLSEMVKAGDFREDLYYRLHVYPITLPPLRERTGDIPVLSHYLLNKICGREERKVPSISESVIKIMEKYSWPGNIREMENVIEWIAITWDADVIEPSHLPKELTGVSDKEVPVPLNNREFLRIKKELRDSITSRLEQKFIVEALKRNDGNVTKAAAEVGIKRQNFQSLMRKHKIRPGKKRSGN